MLWKILFFPMYLAWLGFKWTMKLFLWLFKVIVAALCLDWLFDLLSGK